MKACSSGEMFFSDVVLVQEDMKSTNRSKIQLIK